MKISIITVAFNSQDTISRTIESVLMQKDVQLEYLIIDGASTDKTIEIAESYCEQFEKKGIQFYIKSEPDNGIYDAMNKGILLSTGDIIGIINSDDYYTNNNILHSVCEEFEKSQIDSLYGNLLYIKNNKPYRYWKSGSPRTFKFGWMPPHPTVFIKKIIYEKYGLFRLDLGTAADYELLLRFFEKNAISTKWVNQLFVYMEAGGASGKNLEAYKKSHKSDQEAWVINNLKPMIGFAWLKKLRKLPQLITAKFFKYKPENK